MVVLDKPNYIIAGEGQPVFLLNGQFMPISTWEDIIEDLQRWYKVIALEFPNQGSSPTYGSYVSMMDYCEYFLEFIDHIGIRADQLIVFGLSFGANIIRMLSLKMQVRFKAIIIGGVNPIYRKAAGVYSEYREIYSLIESKRIEKFAREYYSSVFSDTFIGERDGIIEISARKLRENYEHRPEALIALIKASESFYPNMYGLEEKYPCDTYVIAGTQDHYVDHSLAKHYAEIINAGFYEIDAGHAFTVENNFEFMSILHGILQKYDN